MMISILLLVALARHVYGVSVTLGIPCIYEDLEHLEQLNKSIVQQSSVPNEIIVVVSGAEKCPSFIGWTVVCLRERITAGIARNLAWKLASSDVVSFIDADDEMYPERISVIRQYFSNEPDLQLLLHDSAKHPVHEHTMHTYPVQPVEEGYEFYNHMENKRPKIEGRTIAHGHVSVRRTLKCERFRDEKHAEDVYFVVRCVRQFGPQARAFKALRVPLTRYITRAHRVILSFKPPFGGGTTFNERYGLLRSYMLGRRVAEWGIGDSTVLAQKALVQDLVGIDSSSEWVANVSKLVPRFDLRHINIGPVGLWGYPVDKTHVASWPHYSLALQNDKPFDIYFVDGPFQIACVCQALMHGHRHKYSFVILHAMSSISYDIVFKVAEVVNKVDSIIILRRKLDVSDETIWKLWEKHKYDIR